MRFLAALGVVLGVVAFALLLSLGAEAFDRVAGCAADPASCEATP